MTESRNRFDSSSSTLKVAAGTDNDSLPYSRIGESSDFPLGTARSRYTERPYIVGATSSTSASISVIPLADATIPSDYENMVGPVVLANANFATIREATVLSVDRVNGTCTLSATVNLTGGGFKIYTRNRVSGPRLRLHDFAIGVPGTGWVSIYSGIGNAIPSTFKRVGGPWRVDTTIAMRGMEITGEPLAPLWMVATLDAAPAAYPAQLSCSGRWQLS